MNSGKDPEKIALVDLDGTLADYDAAMRRDLIAIANPADEPLGEDFWKLKELPWFKARMLTIRSQPGWWRRLARIESGFQIVRLAAEMGFSINVLSKGPDEHPWAWAEKLEWCQAQPELANAGVQIVARKNIVYGTVLIDDFGPYMDAWMEHRPRGLGIMPTNASNRDYRHDNVIHWDGTNLEAVRAALQAAYDRGYKGPLNLSP
jgi:5'-nucleotidase